MLEERDYPRLVLINSQSPQSVPPKRTHARHYGYPSSTLPLTPLSATAAASTPGWIVTPSGRVVRPMRMRPERPLESMRSELSASKVKGTNGKVKKRVKLPPARARRRLIDPTKWDSVYLKGVFLDNVSVSLPISKDAPESSGPVKYDTLGEEDGTETEDDGADSDVVSSIVRKEIKSPRHISQLVQDRARAVPSVQQSQEAVPATPSRIREATEFSDVRDEANAVLAMLDNMFGDNEDWDGRESVTEMEDLGDNEAGGNEMQEDEEDEIEIVPCDFGVGEGSKVAKKDKGKGKEQLVGVVHFGYKDDLETARDADVEMDGPPVSIEVLAQAAEPAPRTNLKALFAPREEGLWDLPALSHC